MVNWIQKAEVSEKQQLGETKQQKYISFVI